MDSLVGHLPTVLQRYWKVLVPLFMTLQNIFQRLHLQRNNRYNNADKTNKSRPIGRFFIDISQFLVFFSAWGRIGWIFKLWLK